ncbi:TauD/TfdA family dioxygenase [Embleya hyalina]|uniref:TauD/TfdA-like domain-containing protein n=1 Tax=Embleya hyalina TaxID=516124 RepID=A0A401YEP7_9ACTN|nr:TauD/TfdA family dioxygenase [Embleya hyalina]GCD93028.1 hypothetical protein EHYA_00671 [Embleya hyalina]
MKDEPAVERRRRWDRATLREEDWLIHLSSRPAGAAHLARPTDDVGAATYFQARDDVRRRLVSALREGPGLAVVRGLPLDGLTDRACADLCRSVLSLVGSPRPPESAAPMDHILTTGPLAPDERHDAARGPAHHPALAPHTDRAGPPGPPRLLALLCVRPAITGGDSLLISGHTIHARLSADHPAALPTLRRDFHFGAEAHLARTGPVLTRTGGRLTVHYNRHQIDRGHEAAGDPLTHARIEALDAVDEVLRDESLFLRLPLRRGDVLVLDNTTVLHGRTSFVDHPEPLRHRCLARAWAD